MEYNLYSAWTIVNVNIMYYYIIVLCLLGFKVNSLLKLRWNFQMIGGVIWIILWVHEMMINYLMVLVM